MSREQETFASRRALIVGLAVSAVAVPAVAAPLAATDIAGLWRSCMEVKGKMTIVWAAYEAAEATLPAWARPGPEYVDHTGLPVSMSCEVGWPAIQNTKLPSEGAYQLVRPGPDYLKKTASQLSGPFNEAAARSWYDRELAAFEARLAAQRLEERRAGMPALLDRWDALSNRGFAIEEAILRLAPNSPAVLCAHVMVNLVRECDTAATAKTCPGMTMGVLTLRALLPSLTGALAEDAAEFVNNPTRSMEDMRANRGIA